jgi:hypothetical protein
MKINRKFLKQVQLSTFPRKSIQYIRKCYMEGGIFREDEMFAETILSPRERKIHLREMRKGYASMLSVSRVQSKYPTLVRPIINVEMCSPNSSSSLSFEELCQQIIETSCYPIVPDNVWTLAFSIPVRPVLVTKPDTCLNETSLIKPRTLPYCGVSNLAPFYLSYGVTT